MAEFGVLKFAPGPIQHRAMAVLSLLGLLPVLSSAQSQGGDYMSQYAAPYQQYMQGAAGSGSDGYQKYYSKYTSEYGSGGGGGYDKYMSKYAGNYASKYMPSSESDKSSGDADKAVSFAAAEASIEPINCKRSALSKESLNDLTTLLRDPHECSRGRLGEEKQGRLREEKQGRLGWPERL